MNIKINRLDHFVLTVANVEQTCQFYDRVLGIESLEFGSDRRKALRFKRTGAIGALDSIYIRDPDGNLIEIASYLE